MLKINNLSKSYGKTIAVDNLSLEVKEGEIFGFIGPNGAGKSTTIKAILDLLNKDQGEVYIHDVLFDRKNYQLKKIIGYLPSEVHLYEDLTVNELFKFNQKFYEDDVLEKAYQLANRLELDLQKKIEDLSFGNLKKVGIVLALMHNPSLVIMDEATSGLDPLMQEEFYKILLEEKAKGTTIFFSSHILSEIKKICDRVGIIKQGKLLKVEAVKDISSNQALIITLPNELVKIKEKYQPKIINENNHEFKFIYDQDINILLKELSVYNLSKILIEEPSIEQVFMHYYQ